LELELEEKSLIIQNLNIRFDREATNRRYLDDLFPSEVNKLHALYHLMCIPFLAENETKWNWNIRHVECNEENKATLSTFLWGLVENLTHRLAHEKGLDCVRYFIAERMLSKTFLLNAKRQSPTQSRKHADDLAGEIELCIEQVTMMQKVSRQLGEHDLVDLFFSIRILQASFLADGDESYSFMPEVTIKLSFKRLVQEFSAPKNELFKHIPNTLLAMAIFDEEHSTPVADLYFTPLEIRSAISEGVGAGKIGKPFLLAWLERNMAEVVST